jgi:hypothetical protein
LRSVIDWFEEGKKQAQQWKVSLDRSETIINTFKDDFIYSNHDAFVKTDGLRKLSLLLGSQLPDTSSSVPIPLEPKPIVMFGPRRSGKTSTARHFSEMINKTESPQYAQYIEYNENFWDWWEHTDFKETQIFFFDGVFPILDNLTDQSLRDLENRSRFDRIIVVVILNNIEYHWLRLKAKKSKPLIFGKNPFEFHFKKSSPIEIEQMLTLRTEVLGNKYLLSNEVIKYITAFSFGLPGLALWFTRQLSFSEDEDNEIRPPTLEEVHIVHKRLGFEPSLSLVKENNNQLKSEFENVSKKEIWPIKDLLNDLPPPFSKILENIKNISNSRLPILEEMVILDHFEGTIKRSELQERTGIKDSSLTYQCQNLIKEDVVNYFRDGREVFYQLTSPTKEALELLFFD